MLTVRFSKPEQSELIDLPMKLFNFVYDDKWFEDTLVQEMIKNIDKSEYLEGNLFKNPIFDYVRAEELSTGVKTLILGLKYDTDKYYQLSNLGDNCYKELAKFQNEVNIKFWADCLPKMQETDLVFVSEEEDEVLDDICKFIHARIRNGWR